MMDRFRKAPLLQDLVGASFAQVAQHTNRVARKRRQRPAKLAKRFTHNRDVLRWITQQMRADPVHGGCVFSCQYQSHRQRLRRQWTIALPCNNRVHDMNYPSLDRVRNRAIWKSVKQNPIEIETRAPDGVVAKPGTLDA